MKSFDETWEKVHSENAWGKYPSIDVVTFVARNFYNKNRPEIKILDLGCGAGANTWYLAKEGFDTYAIDGSKSAIAKTEKYLENLGLSAKTNIGDISELPYQESCFDCVIDSAVIYANSLPSIKTIINECYRVLKKGGMMFSTGLFSVNTTGFGTGRMIEENTYTDITVGNLAGTGTCHFFNRQEIFDLYSSAGFEILSIDSCTKTERNERVVVSYYTVIARKI